MERDLPRARCWLEVDTAAICANLRLARECLKPETTLIAVLKADAYGLGLAPVARLLWEHGVRHFSVACLNEAFALREALPQAWILCMGEALDGALDKAIQMGIRLTVGSMESAARVSEAALEGAEHAFVHFKVDTGLHRLGFASETAAEGIARCCELPNLTAEGMYTHLSLHDRESDIGLHDRFERVREALAQRGVCPPMLHMLDSIGTVRYPDWQYQAVRIGALLYGNAPRGFDRAQEVRPTVRFSVRVARVFTALKGDRIGYDDDHPLARDTRIAVLTAGYADGYPRVFSGVGTVEIRGQRAKNVGLICMDQMMVDVTEIDGVCVGDEAVLLGGGISLAEYAALGRLNRNECTAIIGKRVPRIYL